MKFKPNWKSIIIVDLMFVGGLITSLFIINKPIFLYFVSSNLDVEVDYLAVIMADSILLFTILYVIYIQYCHLNTVFTNKEVIRPKLFGQHRYEWANLESVVLNMYVVNMAFRSGKMSVLIYLFSNTDEVISFIGSRYSKAIEK
jgi:hypothetical protein